MQERTSSNDASLDAAHVLAQAQTLLMQISEMAVAAKSASAAASEDQRLASLALADAQAKLADIAAASTAALTAKTQIVADQAVIATKSDHIEGAQAHADKIRGDLDRALTAATQQVTDVEGMATRAKTASDSAAVSLAEISATKASSSTEALAITALRESAKESADLAKGLAEKSTQVETRLIAYEASLADLETRSVAQLEEITRLLPGATSAGLAHAFDERRKAFLMPGDRWQKLFVGSIACLVALSLWGLIDATTANAPPSFEGLFRLWMARLPIAAALIWLALHSSREAALSKRLEEDYAYKAAVASSFQGFHKQMAEIGASEDRNLALDRLCEDTLATIGSPPGRIYDKHRLIVTPSSEMAAAAKDAMGAGAAVK